MRGAGNLSFHGHRYDIPTSRTTPRLKSRTDHFINNTRTRAPLHVTFEVITTARFSSGINDTLMNP
jgi:hypothetical protein